MINVQEVIEREIEIGMVHPVPPDYTKLAVPGRYHLVATSGDLVGFLYRDGEFFLVNRYLPRLLERFTETEMTSHMTKNDFYLVLHFPIPLDDLTEWPAYAKKLWRGIVCRKTTTAAL